MRHCIALVVVLAILDKVDSRTRISLYDLATDPEETVNLIDDESYADTIQQFADRYEYWTTVSTRSNIPASTDNQDNWKKCGGLCSWIEDDSLQPSVVEAKDIYSESDTTRPNFVFVMVDDWGWNDLGARSTYLSWTTPNIDRLASEGVSMSNYFTHSQCVPSRGAFMTGRFPIRLGLTSFDDFSELPLSETTLAQHLQSVGYRTYMVGKWHLGFSSTAYSPVNRGFDNFYGYYGDYIDPWDKTAMSNSLFLDLQTGDELVSDKDELSRDLHVAYLMQSKAENAINAHVALYPDDPFFLFYSMPLMGESWSAPAVFLQRCSFPRSEYIEDDVIANAEYNYCAMNAMIDEAVANLTCSLEANGLANNTVLVIVADNGGSDIVRGNNYPFQGGKGEHFRGGLSSTAIIHSKLLPEGVRGTTYEGLLHVTDWFPTFMGLATGNQWEPEEGVDMDGFNIWEAVTTGGESPRTEIIHEIEMDEISMQLGMIKYDETNSLTKSHKPEYDFSFDLGPEHAKYACYMPSLVYDNYITKPKNRFLYDLELDPYESNSVIDDSEYREIEDILQERAEYWANFIRKPEVPDDVLKSAWKECNGVCSWLYSSAEPTLPEVTQKYSYSEAPNIVFVLVDDWGWNDVGYHSTYLPWATPTIDRLASEGIKLENYYTEKSCIPSRGALLTGRYSFKLGLWLSGEGAELPTNETSLARQLKSAGYRNYMVGKWHLGFSTSNHLPVNRGFDYFYGYLNGAVDYWTKSYGTFLDLHENSDLVTDPDEIDSNLHNALLMQMKAEKVIKDHAENFADEPMFLYYAMQLIHGVWSAPDEYVDRCGVPDISNEYLQAVEAQYCALNIMLDEAIANLTCALEVNGMAENTVMVVISDNGGEGTVQGNNYPYRGSKGSYWKGGVAGAGFIHSPLIPDEMRGQSYNGQMHVTDWLPTLMSLATNGDWEADTDIDGEDMWDAIITNGESPREEIVHFHDGTTFSLQVSMMKLDHGNNEPDFDIPQYVFEEDLNPEASVTTCSDPTLLPASSKRPSAIFGTSSSTSSSSEEEQDTRDFYRFSALGSGLALVVASLMLFAASATDVFRDGEGAEGRRIKREERIPLTSDLTHDRP